MYELITTWQEVNGWVVLSLISVIAFCLLWHKGKKESKKYVGWIERGEW